MSENNSTSSLHSVSLQPPFYVLSGPVKNEKAAAPCGLILDETTGGLLAPLFTSEDNANYYLQRTRTRDKPVHLGMVEGLADLAKTLRLRHPQVTHFLLDPRGTPGPQQLLAVVDAMRLGQT